MKNKGFTLIELLAVIVLIGLVGTVGISSLIRTRKNTNIKLAKEMENDIKVAGENLFSYEKISGNVDFNTAYNRSDAIYISLKTLKDNGYLKTDKLKNPANDSDECKGYLEIKRTDSGPEFKGHVKCDKLYTTDNHYHAPSDSDYFYNLSNEKPQ